MSMTIYFKSGETVHIPGEEGQLMKEEIRKAIVEGMGGLVALSDEDTRKIGLILNLDEVAAIR